MIDCLAFSRTVHRTAYRRRTLGRTGADNQRQSDQNGPDELHQIPDTKKVLAVKFARLLRMKSFLTLNARLVTCRLHV